MEELLILAIQFFVEVLLNVFVSFPVDLPSRNRTTPEREVIWPICLLWLALAGGIGWLSTLFLPRTLLSVSSLRIANLVVSPVLAAYFAEAVATRRSKHNPFIIPRNHFWLAFWFTVGFAVIRFAYVSRA